VGSWAPLLVAARWPPFLFLSYSASPMWAMGKGGWSAPAASMGGDRRPLGAAGCSLGCAGSEVAADAGRGGSPDLRPDLKMVAPSHAARHTPLALECMSSPVAGAGDGSDRGKPLVAGGGHDVDGAAGVDTSQTYL
jgi:hypothetical protein